MDLGHIGKLGWGGLKSCQFILHTQHLKTPNDWSLLLLPRTHAKGFAGESHFQIPPQGTKQCLGLLSIF